MNLNEFKASLNADAPPGGVGPALRALWHQARGEWDRAHGLVQDQGDESGAWVHAHLHRARGEEGNAGYWYRRAGKPPAQGPLNEECDEIVAALLSKRMVRRGERFKWLGPVNGPNRERASPLAEEPRPCLR